MIITKDQKENSRVPFDATLLRIFGMTIMVVMGVSSIMPIVPLLGRTFDLEPKALGLVFIAFTMPGIILTPVSGVLADRIGRRKILIPALFIFGIGGAACAFATSFTQLLCFRFIQGIGVAPLTILYATLVGDHYQGNQRMQAMGFCSAVLSLGTAIYPALGGLLGEVHWRAPFLLPLLAIPLAFAFIRYPLAEPRADLPLNEYIRNAKASILSSKAFVLFILTFLVFSLLYGPMVTYFPILSDQKFNASPSTIGLVFSIASAGSVLTAVFLGMLAKHLPKLVIFLMGTTCYGIAMFSLPNLPSLWWALGPIFIYGLAQGLTIPTIATMLTGLAPTESRGAIMAVNGTILRLSQTVAPAFFSLIYAYGSIEAVYYCGTAIACTMFLISLARIR